jgi:hypothetical protein
MLGHVFARLRQWLLPTGATTASPTQSAGPVFPEPTTPTGSPCSAGTTCPQCQPVNQASSQSSEAVQPTSVDQNSGSETPPASVTNQSKAVGTKQATTARQTRRVASRAARAKRVAAQSTPLEPLSVSGKAPAQTPTDSQSGVSGKPKAVVPRTHQPAKSAAKPKQKPAKQGSSGKKTSRAKASAPTRMVKRSGASGT